MSDPQRFAPFTDDELVELWDALTTDDGIRYGLYRLEADGTLQPALAVEVRGEALRRGLVARDEGRWAP
jgi:hypothetical protein